MLENNIRWGATALLVGALFAGCEGGRGESILDHPKQKQVVDKSGDACGFSEPVSLEPPDSEGMVAVPPSHPFIRYIGRIDCANPRALGMAHVGAQIQVWLEGARVDMMLRDFGTEELPNFYNVIVDDGEPSVLAVSPEQERYTLADRLGSGVHSITIFKRTESCADGNENIGKGVFSGLRIPQGATLLAPPPFKRPLIEFIGDSITCGYGNGVSTFEPAYYPYSTENANGYLAYGAVAARMLDATYVPVAYSGRGMVRNWAGYNGKTLPEMYLDILPDDPNPGQWNVNRYMPDIIVINLGTNDFSEGLPLDALPELRGDYERAYGQFLETLRRYYPDARIILAAGPMISDAYPAGYAARTSILAILSRLIQARRARGDDNIHLLEHAHQTPPYGEDWHPTAARHRIMADELVRFIQSLRDDTRPYTDML